MMLWTTNRVSRIAGPMDSGFKLGLPTFVSRNQRRVEVIIKRMIKNQRLVEME
jgi:hypothetical protein